MKKWMDLWVSFLITKMNGYWQREVRSHLHNQLKEKKYSIDTTSVRGEKTIHICLKLYIPKIELLLITKVKKN